MCQEEAQQRTKTFISLHLRDKTLALTMSSICWLPSYDHSLSPQIIPSTFADPHIVDRAHLAEIQEQLYRYLAVEPQQQTPRELASIYQNLDKWVTSHDIYGFPFLSLHEAELRLTFLATRMLAYSCSRDDSRRQALLEDARTSCIILLIAYEKHDQGMLSMFKSLRSTSPGKMHNTASAASKSPPAGRLTSLINAFPVMAFFQLTKNIMWSEEPEHTSKSGEVSHTDLKLLQDVYTCTVEVNSRTPSQNRASQIECIFSKVLESDATRKHRDEFYDEFYARVGLLRLKPSTRTRHKFHHNVRRLPRHHRTLQHSAIAHRRLLGFPHIPVLRTDDESVRPAGLHGRSSQKEATDRRHGLFSHTG
jgi:hypothetical protein